MRAIALIVATLALVAVVLPAQALAANHVTIDDRARGGYYAVSVLDGASCWKHPCVAVGGGGPTVGTVAIAGFGSAASNDCPDRVIKVCVSVAVAGTGDSHGSVSVSLLSDAHAEQICAGPPGGMTCVDGVAVSGVGSSSGAMAVAYGSASGTQSCLQTALGQVCTATAAVSAVGPASGTGAASVEGQADGGIVAASLFGDARGPVAATGTGDAEGSLLAVCLDQAPGWQPDPRGLCPDS